MSRLVKESDEEIDVKPGLYFSFFGFYAHAVHSVAKSNGRFEVVCCTFINLTT